mmetsp:Transcript_25651/g.45535  ORF Transcript_25651/g.45535 Transcript_25651/m.45535 type:complete len:273 (+) Transcript_25651:2-820(+)
MINTYKNPGPRKHFDPDVVRELRRGYYAAVTWADEQIGRVLREVDSLGLRDSTAVFFHADHGYQLGEKNVWTKHTNFELGTRVPLMVRVPWSPVQRGTKITDRIVELVDVYRTMAEVAGVSEPERGVEGKSFASVLFNITRKKKQSFDTNNTAFSMYPRCPRDLTKLWDNSACKNVKREDIPFMGFSMRNLEWRYNVWLKFNGTQNRGVWEACDSGDDHDDAFCERELYPHAEGEDMSNFDAFEPVNLAGKKENAAVVRELHQKIRRFFDTK